MNPALDQFLVMVAIGAAFGFFAMRFFRKKKGGQCSSGSCCTPAQPLKKPRRK